MRLHLIKSSFVLLPLNLAACTTNTGAPGGGQWPDRYRRHPGPGRNGRILPEPGRQPVWRPAGNIATQDPVPRSFGSLVEGTAYTGAKTYIFNCRFDPSGNFIGISEA